MQIGVFDHLDRGAVDLDTFFEDRLRLIERYDAAGIRSYHLAEHHGTPLGMAPSPGLFLVAAAQRTKHLRLGPMVYCLPLYNPLRLIEEICMLDHLSSGRLELGIGRGISPVEAGFYQLDPSQTPAMYREGLDFILKGLAGEDFNFDGTFYRVSDMPMVLYPQQQPHPPLWYGIAHPDAAEWPARNGVNIISNQPPETVRAITDSYRATWAAAGNPDAELPLMGLSCHVVVAETEREALETARRGYCAWRESFMYLWNRASRAPINVSYPEEFDDLAANDLGVAGTPEQVTESIEQLAELAGINYFVCRLAFGDLSFDETARSLDLLANRVMPSLGTATVAA